MARVTAIAEYLGLTARRIQQLVKSGILPKPDTKGHYDLQGCTAAYAAYQRQQLRSLRAGGGGKAKPKWRFQKSESTQDPAAALDGALNEIFERLAAAREKRKR